MEFQKKRSDLGVGYFDFAEEDGFLKFQDFLKNQSLFQTAKMAILGDSFQVPGETLKELKKVLQEVVENKNITVLMSEKDKPMKALEFLRKEPVLAQEFEFLESAEWESFVRREIEKRGINIAPEGVRFLTQVYEGNTWALITELDKIQFLGDPSTGSGPRAETRTRDLEDLGVAEAPNFWGLILGFKSRNLPQKLWALEKVLGSNEPPAKIFNILAYQLPEKLQDLARYDLMVKSGKLEYEEALLELAISQ